MINHISGRLIEKFPTHVIIEANGVGYHLNISLNTFSKIGDSESCKLLAYLSIKEDAHTLYGFIDEAEREIFILLISVNGVGPNTARMMLSSLTPDEVVEAIATGDVGLLQGVKGIGAKTAQRIILDLKDKIDSNTTGESGINSAERNTKKEEALSALLALGFTKASIEKVLRGILKAQPSLDVEGLIKAALKKL
jgi:Holliday junction DNA helicase RuvA